MLRRALVLQNVTDGVTIFVGERFQDRSGFTHEKDHC